MEGDCTWRQTLKTQRLPGGARRPMKSAATKASCPFCLEAPSSHFPAREKLLNLPGGLQEREGSGVTRAGQREREVRACGEGPVSLGWIFTDNKEQAKELNEAVLRTRLTEDHP